MEESLDELLEAVTIKDAESEKFNSLIHENRKKEFLAVRLCLKVVTGDDNLLIRYNELNKPDIPGEYYISISHTGDYVAIYLDKSSEVGIDIEQLHERATLRKRQE